jgi:ureidoglycolate lyase
MSADRLPERTIVIEDATPEAIAPFGVFVGAGPGIPIFAQWTGVTVHGPTPIAIGERGELLHVTMAAGRFPATVELLERHPRHTQTYLSANGKSFVMVLGAETEGGLPSLGGLRAFLFKGGAGVVMHAGTWHEFPVALDDDTRFTVVLSAESHVNELTDPEFPLDARGPDLERFDMSRRARIVLRFRGSTAN